MATPYEIPLSPKAQKFTIRLGPTDYVLSLRWNPVSACWLLSIADENGVSLVDSIPVITGTDLLVAYKHLKIPGKLIAQTDSNADAVPTYSNLGITGRLYYVVD